MRPENVQWYYLVADKTCGPSTTDEIRHYIVSGATSLDSRYF